MVIYDNMKKLLLRLVIIIAAASLAPCTVASAEADPTYRTKEECEQKTSKTCDSRMCDYIPEGKTFEEVCGKDFKKGWHPSQAPTQNTAFDLSFSTGGSIFGNSFEVNISGVNTTYQETTPGGTKEVKKIERTLLPAELEDIRKTVLDTNLINLQPQDSDKIPTVTDQASYNVSLSMDGKNNSISCYITPPEIAPPSECEKQMDKLRLKLNSILGVGIY